MPAFEMKANLYSLDVDDFEEVIEIFKLSIAGSAVRAFLKAALRRIPVRTGFLRGAFRDIERAFGVKSDAQLNPILAHLFGDGGKLFKEVEAAFDKKRPSSKKAGEKRAAELAAKASKREKLKNKSRGQRNVEYYYFAPKRKIVKTTTAGLIYATTPDKVFTNEGNAFRIYIDVQISYYRVNDFFSRIKGAPWGSMDAGAAALVNSLERSVNKFPQLAEIVGTIKIATVGSTLTKGITKPDIQKIKSRLLSITGFE